MRSVRLQVADAKTETLQKCKRNINSCLRENTSTKDVWKSLVGREVEASSLKTVRILVQIGMY